MNAVCDYVSSQVDVWISFLAPRNLYFSGKPLRALGRFPEKRIIVVTIFLCSTAEQSLFRAVSMCSEKEIITRAIN